MKNKKLIYLIFISIVLAVYYLALGITIHNKGYYNHESLFYIEKARIAFQGLGNRLKVIGLTSPIIPFFAMMPYTVINYGFAPVAASAIGTALLFFIIGISIQKTTKDPFFFVVLLVLFLLHPGIIYLACSGKSIYIILIFFFAESHMIFLIFS